jgi:hypothetical protein
VARCVVVGRGDAGLIGVARARWTGLTLRVEVEGFLHLDTSLAAADQTGRSAAAALAAQIPQMHGFTWTARAA